MKVLNRPMFRMGGPIKEGIMDGIKEPRRQGYAMPPGLVIQNDPNKIIVNRALENAKSFENIFQPDLNKNIQDNKLIVDQNIFATKPLKKNTYASFDMAEAAPEIIPSDDDILQQKLTIIANKANDGKRLNNDDIALAETYGITYGKELFESENRADIEAKNVKRATESLTGQPYRSTAEIKQDELSSGKISQVGENETGDMKIEEGPLKKERVNTILEGLGYDRAQKNALYDAMIKAGQRISRTGLGAENLVSDVIAETSQSYDKPEKLREAANLMDVQQQLKLDQIAAGKSNQMEESVNFLMSDKGGKKSRTEALDIVLKNPRSGGEAFYNAYKEIKDSKKAVDRAVEWAVSRGEYKQPIGRIDTKKYDSPAEFFKSKDFKGAGNYILKGTIFQIDAQGNATKIEQYYDSKGSSGFMGFGKDTD
jgi:hypothetical protein